MESAGPSSRTSPVSEEEVNPLIHSMFARGRWLRLSEEDYKLIEETLVLASRILLCARALHFFHALAYGPKVVAMFDQDSEDVGCFCRIYKDSSRPLPPQNRHNISSVLESMSAYMTFAFEDIGRRHGECCANDEKPVRGSSFRVGSDIKIHTTLLEDLRTSDSNRNSSANATRDHRSKQIYMAIVMVHEVAHAMHNAINGDCLEMFFENDTFAETGQALEKWLFGGGLHCTQSSHEMALINIPSTDFLLSKSYADLSYSSQVLKPPKYKDVSKAWIDDFFTDAFWTRDDILNGARLFKGFR